MRITHYLRSRLLFCMALLMGMSSLLVMTATPAAAAPRIPAATVLGTLRGSAYGAFLQAKAGSGIASVGPLVPIGLGCVVTSQSGSNSGSLTGLGSFLSGGTATTSVAATQTAASASIQSIANVQTLNLFGGLITADQIRAVANSSADSTTASSSATGTLFTNMVINGTPQGSTPAPNTKVSLPGIGTVTVNEQVGPVNSANATSITVIGLDVNVTLSNSFGLPIGTHILIAYATTSFTRTAPAALVAAYAYGVFTSGLGATASGPFAPVGLDCTGGNNTNSVSSVNASPISTGAITSVAFGSANPGGSTVSGETTIQNVNITGLLTANVISVRGTASFTPTLHGYTGYAILLVNASLLGGTISLPASPAPNTVIQLPGITVVLDEQSTSTGLTSSKININAIDITVSGVNLLGLPVGARIIVGHADASVTSLS